MAEIISAFAAPFSSTSAAKTTPGKTAVAYFGAGLLVTYLLSR